MDCLQHIIRPDIRAACEIGEGTGDFENPVVGTGGEIHHLHRVFEVAGAFGLELAMLANQP